MAEAINTLRSLRDEVAALPIPGATPYLHLNRWRVWSSRAMVTGAAYFPERELQRLLVGPLYGLLHTIEPAATSEDHIRSLIDAEMQTRKTALDVAVNLLTSAWAEWDKGTATAVVLDTNVLMEYGPRLAHVNWHEFVGQKYQTPLVILIPIEVVEELDGLKDRGSTKQRASARESLRWLDGLFGSSQLSTALTEAPSHGHSPKLRVWIDDNDRVPLPRTDADILDRILPLQGLTGRTLLVSQDRSMQFRARSLGIEARHMSRDEVPDAMSMQAPTTD